MLVTGCKDKAMHLLPGIAHRGMRYYPAFGVNRDWMQRLGVFQALKNVFHAGLRLAQAPDGALIIDSENKL